MKTAFRLVALIFVGAAISSRAQGTILFSTGYGVVNYARVIYSDGTPVGRGFTAQLYGGPQGTPVGELIPLFPTTVFRDSHPETLGYVQPMIVDIPNVSIDDKATVIMRAYNGPDWESSTCRGESAPIDVFVYLGAGRAGELNGLQPFSVNCVPEPGTTSIAILGGSFWILGHRSRYRPSTFAQR
ncbi:MAG: hypothetical protein JNK85_22715 [Verrucomicrobiales bacterium]|nr:hypothetical protein [Verrucomicrobiales bacterium]